jgi:hypothetical protein
MTMTKGLSALAVCFGLLLAFGNARGDDGAERLKTRLEGFQEVPAIASGGTAVFRAKIAEDDQSFEWELEFSGLMNVTQSHIHIGQLSVNGAIVIFLCTNIGNGAPNPKKIQACPTQAGSVTGKATAADVIAVAAQGVAGGGFATVLDAIRSGVAYANIHTSAHPGGEIRGQIHHQGQ